MDVYPGCSWPGSDKLTRFRLLLHGFYPEQDHEGHKGFIVGRMQSGLQSKILSSWPLRPSYVIKGVGLSVGDATEPH
jgi:hypothetical protein